LKILLSCTGGLTTSLFATQLNDGAKVMGFDYEFDAISYTNLYEKGKQYDVLLLAPQIAYKKAEVSKVFPRQIVATIPGVIFATYNVASTFELIKQLMASHHKTHLRAQSTIGLKKDVNNPGLLLSVAVVRHYDETCIHYRLYDHDEIISNHRVVKPRFESEDLQDGIDAMLAKYPQTAIVGISVPRSIYDDIVMLPLDMATDQEFLEYLKDRYPDKSFYWFNDADSLAVGYYVSQNDYDNLSFMFLPRLTDTGGIGSVFNGQLIVGKETLAGEPGYYLIPFLGDEVGELSKTVEGTARLIAISLVPVIALLAPDAIVINCVMLPDTKLLKDILMHYFPERFLPDLIKVNALSDYMLIGTMVSCAKSHYEHD
ncbi:MAG: ROK family protein, partial [Erysipelotrichaceae bacterium]|nr:ROK family protein [Erysipelotrichaceae bacterium]